MTYTDCYRYYHDIATRYAKQGTKNLRGVCGLKCRLDPSDPDKVQLGSKWYVAWHDDDADKTYHAVPAKDRPFYTYVTLDPRGVLIPEFVVPDAHEVKVLLKAYPKVSDPRMSSRKRVRRCANATLNNLLEVLHWNGAPLIRHEAHRERNFVGFDWILHGVRTPIVGAVYFDAEQNKLLPMEAQPTKTVDDATRKLMHTRLRAAFKRLRMLHVLEVVPTVDDLIRCTGATADRYDYKQLMAWAEQWGDAQRLLELLETTDFTEPAQVAELHWRMAVVIWRGKNYRYLSGPTQYDALKNLWGNWGTTMINEQYLRQVRDALSRALGIVKYV